MAKPIVIGIHLGKKDADLKRWFLKIKELELEQSFYIKKAIMAYINKENLLIGKICSYENLESFNTSYTVSPNDIEIVNFINQLEDSGIKVSSFLKKILRSYIEPVDNIEDEYIPSYFDVQLKINKIEASKDYQNTNKDLDKDNDILKHASDNINTKKSNKKDIKEDSKKIKNPLIDDYI